MQYAKNISLGDNYISPDRKHSALIIDVQRDFSLQGAAVETPGTLPSVSYIKRLVQAYRDSSSNSSCYKTLS
jgi:hypothetical protein